MSLECEAKTLDKVFGTEPLQVCSTKKLPWLWWMREKKKENLIQIQKEQHEQRSKNTEDCPLVLKENAAGILSVVNAAAV